MFYLSDFKNIGCGEKDVFHSSDEKKNTQKTKKKKGYTRPKFLTYLFKLLDEYCKFSSLHGLRYIRDTSLPRKDRFLWLGVFVICVCISGIIVKDAYLTGITNEFQLVYEPKSTAIWKIPFPAVLVCSSNPVRKSVFDLNKKVNNYYKFTHFSKLICLNKMDTADVYNVSIDEEFFEFLTKTAIPCQDLITNCFWKSQKRDCCSLFEPIVTFYGLCYVFNSLPADVVIRHYRPMPGAEFFYDENMIFWDIEKGYQDNLSGNNRLVRPLRSIYGGLSSALTFDLVDHKEEWQHNCSGSDTGFKVIIYPPDGFPETEAIMRIPTGVHSHVKLTPYLITTEQSLRSVSVDSRECLFQDEFQLDYFNYYSQSACQIECFTKSSLLLCGCMPFTSHRIIGRYGYPYCKDSSSRCLLEIVDHLIAIGMSKGRDTSYLQRNCSCNPGCYLLNYEFQSSFQRFGRAKSSSLKGSNHTLDNFARLSVYYSANQFNAISRVRVSDIEDIIGNCGGLLGLLLGFSFMSFFEVIYFIILRPVKQLMTFIVTE